MPISKIDRLTDGLNELINPRNLPDGGLQESVNYEILGDGKLTKRKDPVEYGDYVTGDSLKTKLSETFTSSIQQISPPYYPVKKIEDMVGDYIILIFGLTETGYKLYMFYEDSTTWVAEEVVIGDIEYNSDTYLEFAIGDDSIIITETDENSNNNLPHYFRVNSEGETTTGVFGVPAPIAKPTLEELTEYNNDEFEKSESNNRLGNCGIIQCLYTVETEDGEESNPSPISNSRVMQFFEKDTTDFSDRRWIKKITVKNIAIPNITGDVREKLKYFNLYYRIIRYSASEEAQDFYFAQRVNILDKTNFGGTTGNTYTIVTEFDPSIQVSYEKDIAPIAKHSAEISGIIGLGNVKEKLRIPFNFDYYIPITIKNANSRNYVDAIIKMRLIDATQAAGEFVENLYLEQFDKDLNGWLNRLRHIRIYDEDLTTPIKVGYFAYNGGTSLDIIIKIPLLVAGNDKVVYLCWNNTGTKSKGVDDENYRNYDNGKFIPLNSQSNYEEIFSSERVLSVDSEITSPMDIQRSTIDCINRADSNRNGEFTGTASWVNERIAKQLSTGYFIGQERCVRLGLEQSTSAENLIKYDLTFLRMPEQITMWGRLKYNQLDMGNGIPYQAIWGFYKSGSMKGIAGIFNSLTKQWGIIIGTKIAYFDNIGHEPVTVDSDAGQDGDYFYFFSINMNNNLSLFIGDNNDKTLYYDEISWDEFDDELEDSDFDNIGKFTLGAFGKFLLTDLNLSIPGCYYDQWQVLKNQYYSASSEKDIETVKYIADFMPDYDAPIGLKI